ncbi:MAG TPA: hypothetical protein EYP52_09885, partial [Anaerolineae bacterium]|nr:hypothetical protein [Anaerolineae bacterium]
VVLSKIKSDHAARVLGVLPENFAMEVIMRLLRTDSIHIVNNITVDAAHCRFAFVGDGQDGHCLA